MDVKQEARNIIIEFTDNIIRSAHYDADNNEELYEFMTEGCAGILTDNFMNGKCSPMEYNAIRNELAKILWDLFEPYISKEHND